MFWATALRLGCYANVNLECKLMISQMTKSGHVDGHFHIFCCFCFLILKCFVFVLYIIHVIIILLWKRMLHIYTELVQYSNGCIDIGSGERTCEEIHKSFGSLKAMCDFPVYGFDKCCAYCRDNSKLLLKVVVYWIFCF